MCLICNVAQKTNIVEECFVTALKCISFVVHDLTGESLSKFSHSPPPHVEFSYNNNIYTITSFISFLIDNGENWVIGNNTLSGFSKY